MLHILTNSATHSLSYTFVEPETVVQNGCLDRELDYSSLTQGWFSLDASDYKIANESVFSPE